MSLELLAVLGDVGRIEDDRVQPPKELVVDLNPLAINRGRVRRDRIDIMQLKSSERNINQLVHLLVENRNTDAFKLKVERRVDRGVGRDGLKGNRAINRVRPRERAATSWLEGVAVLFVL